ncbi:hypothetical protein BYT27DRAFT_7201478 [Phlegmacium glaucopus]|nr:hypothetical protein BYT27DRAFT_7201478 [Phlegmacium glaucopus]
MKTISTKLICLSCYVQKSHTRWVYDQTHAQSSCRYELKNGLGVVGEFSWRVLEYLWTCVTGKLQSYSSQSTFTSIHRKTPLSFSIYSASRPRSRLQLEPQALNIPMINLRGE